jgi:hypothetical protein
MKNERKERKREGKKERKERKKERKNPKFSTTSKQLARGAYYRGIR